MSGSFQLDACLSNGKLLCYCHCGRGKIHVTFQGHHIISLIYLILSHFYHCSCSFSVQNYYHSCTCFASTLNYFDVVYMCAWVCVINVL